MDDDYGMGHHVVVKLGIWKISRLLTVNLGIPSLIE